MHSVLFSLATRLALQERQEGEEVSGAIEAGPHCVHVPAPRLENVPDSQEDSAVAFAGQYFPAAQVRHSVGPSRESEYVPAEQSVQDDAPLLENFPRGQGNIASAPSLQYLPALHVTQAATLSEELWVPFGHIWQEALPAPLKKPGGQTDISVASSTQEVPGSQVVHSLAPPVVLEKDPAAQEIHAPAPLLEYFPAGQSTISTASSEQNFPASQVVHSLAPPAVLEKDPAEQEMHEPAPTLLKVPFKHVSHIVAPEGQNLPASQDKHEASPSSLA